MLQLPVVSRYFFFMPLFFLLRFLPLWFFGFVVPLLVLWVSDLACAAFTFSPESLTTFSFRSEPAALIERGADTARALRIIRKNAEDYRINPDHVAFIGFSNGGLTGDSNILYFSGEKKLTDYFPDYVPDELDAYYGAPNAFICVYGPRYNGSEADYTGVKYPPTFFAVGREDSAMNNLHWAYPDLVKHGVLVEVHTFAGVPHGVGGVHLLEEEIRYPNFHLWYKLADCFLEDVYKKQAQE